LYYIAEIALWNVCTAGVLGQCATADAECQIDTENSNMCLPKSTHFKDGSLCNLNKFQFSLLHMFLFFVMLRRHYKLFNGINFQATSDTMLTNVCITFIYYDV
jgi:hypothetical protein